VGTINHVHAIKLDTANIRNIIENSLLADWAIRIEYLEAEADSAHWQLWDEIFFALRTAKPVVESLVDCYTKNSNRTIRINAEKFRPQSRLLFTVCNPGYVLAKIA
jgi:ribulose bisphosphate carboxylase small subunit